VSSTCRRPESFCVLRGRKSGRHRRGRARRSRRLCRLRPELRSRLRRPRSRPQSRRSGGTAAGGRRYSAAVCGSVTPVHVHSAPRARSRCRIRDRSSGSIRRGRFRAEGRRGVHDQSVRVAADGFRISGVGRDERVRSASCRGRSDRLVAAAGPADQAYDREQRHAADRQSSSQRRSQIHNFPPLSGASCGPAAGAPDVRLNTVVRVKNGASGVVYRKSRCPAKRAHFPPIAVKIR
jgi:hypothetical protein